MNYTIHNADCLKQLKKLQDNSIDSIVTDPPYEIGFMGKKWDNSGIAYKVQLWKECLRVLKPGGHLLAFGATRSYHRMAVAIEDAGFEIRDSIHWTYGSGFPKSLDVSKAIDKAAGAEREVIGSKIASPKGISSAEQRTDTAAGSYGGEVKEIDITAPATPAAQQWQGWGTALKPSHEPIVVARKPLVGTVAANVLEYGTGGLNIDGCRVGTGDGSVKTVNYPDIRGNNYNNAKGTVEYTVESQGRFPANTVLTHAVKCVENKCVPGCPIPELDKQSESCSRYFTQTNWTQWDDITPFIYIPKASKKERNKGLEKVAAKRHSDRVRTDGKGGDNPRNRTNTPKQNFHPTVKPVELMRHLCRLVTPPNGTVLDPFTGSGSTGVAAILEGFQFVGIELTAEYLPIIESRLKNAEKEYKNTQPTLPLEETQ